MHGKPPQKKDDYKYYQVERVERYLCFLRMKDREQVQALQQLLLAGAFIAAAGHAAGVDAAGTEGGGGPPVGT